MSIASRVSGWVLLSMLSGSVAAQQPLQSVRGTVLDPFDRPIESATILLGTRLTSTNASGAFRFDSVAPGKHPLTIRAIGFNPVHTRVAVVETEPTETVYYLTPSPVLLPTIVVESKRTGIYGTVGDTAFHAAGGAKVEVVGTNGGSTVADSLGRFAFPKADKGFYMIRARYPGFMSRWMSLEMKPGEGKELVLMLTPGRDETPTKDDVALFDLRMRLHGSLSQNRLGPDRLERLESRALCDIPEIRNRLARFSDYIVLLNGVEELRSWPLCAWHADEVSLIELPAAGRSVNRSIMGGGRSVGGPGLPVIVIWTKR